MLAAIMVVFSLAVSSFGQKPATDAEATAAIANGQAGFNNPVVPFNTNKISSIQLTVGPSTVFDATTGAVEGAGSGQAGVNTAAGRAQTGNDDNLVNGEVRHTPLGGTIDGLDTIATFGGAFAAQAGQTMATCSSSPW
jgi:hypothetical protein